MKITVVVVILLTVVAAEARVTRASLVIEHEHHGNNRRLKTNGDSTIILLLGLISLIAVISGFYMCSKTQAEYQPVGPAPDEDLPAEHPATILAERQNLVAELAAEEVAQIAEDVATARTPEERAALVEAMQEKLSEAMEAASVAASCARQAGPGHSERLSFHPQFATASDLVTRMKKLLNGGGGGGGGRMAGRGKVRRMASLVGEAAGGSSSSAARQLMKKRRAKMQAVSE